MHCCRIVTAVIVVAAADDDDDDDDGDDDGDDDDDDLGDVHFFRRTVKRCTSGGVHVPSVYPHAM